MKKTLIIILGAVMLLCITLFSACGEEKEYCHLSFTQDGQLTIYREVEKGTALTDIPVPALEKGYIITWSVEDFSSVTRDMKVTAVKTAKTYDLTFDSNGGSEVSSVSVTYASPYTLPKPTKEGFSFRCWQYQGRDVNFASWEIDEEDIILTATYTYTILFKQEGYPPVSVVLSEGESISSHRELVPEVKSKAGYDVTWDSTAMLNITSNGEICAVERAKSIKIYFDEITLSNIPSGVVLSKDNGVYYVEVTFGSTFSKNVLFTPVKEGFKFDCWEGENEKANVALNSAVWQCEENITVKPRWLENRNVYTFNNYDGSKITEIVLEIGEKLSKTDERVPSFPNETGYEFSWDKDFWLLDKGETITVKRSPKTYVVVFAKPTGVSVLKETKQFTYNEHYSIDNDAVSDKGLYFAGWYYENQLIENDGEKWQYDLPEEAELTPKFMAIVKFTQSGEEDIIKYVDIGKDLTDIPSPKQNVLNKYLVWDVTDFTSITENLTVGVKEIAACKVNLFIYNPNGEIREKSVIYIEFGKSYSIATPNYGVHFEFTGWLYGNTPVSSRGTWNIYKDEIILTTTLDYVSGRY